MKSISSGLKLIIFDTLSIRLEIFNIRSEFKRPTLLTILFPEHKLSDFPQCQSVHS